MIKTDKQFISRLIKGLDRKINVVRDELLTEIRHEGVLREKSDHNIEILVEGHSGLAEQIGRLQADMDQVKEKTDLIPAIYTTVKNHSIRLLALEKR